MKSRWVVVFSLVLLCLIGIAAAGQSSYLFHAAGTYPRAFETSPIGVSLEHTVGYYFYVNGVEGAYIQTGGNFIAAQPAGSRSAYLSGINVSGVAVGGYCPSGCNALSGEHGYTYDFTTGAITTIDYPGITNATTAYGINDLGAVVGGYCPGSFTCSAGAIEPTGKAFLYQNGIFKTLRFPGSGATEANAINNAGTIVGVYIYNLTGPHAFLYQNGVYKNIDFPNANLTVATAINNAGVVARHFQDKNFIIHGFTYQAGVFSQVDMPGALSTAVEGINDRNQLVGAWFPSSGIKNFRAVPRSQAAPTTSTVAPD